MASCFSCTQVMSDALKVQGMSTASREYYLFRLSDVQASQSFALKAPFGFSNSTATVASKKVIFLHETDLLAEDIKHSTSQE